MAGMRLRLREGRIREPDLAFLSAPRLSLRAEEYWRGADLVVEIVSSGAADRARDYVVKRGEYADAGIPEYWIVDPEQESITVLSLQAGQYVETGIFTRGSSIESPNHAGLRVSATAILDAD